MSTRRARTMLATGRRRLECTSSGTKSGAATDRPASAGSPRWACPSVTRTTSANGGADAYGMNRHSWTTCRTFRTPVRQHEGQPRLAQHPARRGAALCGGARPRNLRNLVGLPGRGGRQQRPARFPGLGDCHAARGSWRPWAAVGCAYGASRVLGSRGRTALGT